MSTTIRGDYAGLSRGKHCAKHVETGTWAERDDDGDLILNRPGKWMLHTSDGFSRKATVGDPFFSRHVVSLSCDVMAGFLQCKQ